ncbi:type II RES/Xre toxin-antitoxin system antitoxin [Chitinophaga terrae (ex Kim and Jung 2007)]|jgi:putative toxin-antitoxin system antitoxin component (TIGR02293 family)|nr:antitoxin Xre/MbcA/ParS toxin-binding domain-containing protein [Chitinophaga terrae (ex Kim and Jung 2007)]MDQ0106026.1 putative toxin-antitoxin system antitoxin component (TIGR02293 family) [Chitinophaga terrae (ex Kim and Jung 2007)]
MKHLKGYQVQENALMIVEDPSGTYVIRNGYFDYIQLSRSGIIKRALVNLAKQISFSLSELAQVLHISERTFQRYADDAKLSADTSERAILLSQLYQRGTEVFGHLDDFKEWMRTPLPVFDYQTPISLLDTTFGFQLIQDELGRIEHGIFA